MGSVTNEETTGPAPWRQDSGNEEAPFSISSRSTMYIGDVDVDGSTASRTTDSTIATTASAQFRKSRWIKVFAFCGVATLLALTLVITIATMGDTITATEEEGGNSVGVNAGERQPMNLAPSIEPPTEEQAVLGEAPEAETGVSVRPPLISDVAVVSDASDAPSDAPTVTPTATPTARPTARPTATPTATPTAAPTAAPTPAASTAAPTEGGKDDGLGFGGLFDAFGFGFGGSSSSGDDNDNFWGLGLGSSSGDGDVEDGGDLGCFDDLFCCFTLGLFC